MPAKSPQKDGKGNELVQVRGKEYAACGEPFDADTGKVSVIVHGVRNEDKTIKSYYRYFVQKTVKNWHWVSTKIEKKKNFGWWQIVVTWGFDEVDEKAYEEAKVTERKGVERRKRILVDPKGNPIQSATA